MKPIEFEDLQATSVVEIEKPQKKLVWVVGINGVGKSYLSKLIARKTGGEYLSGSDMLKRVMNVEKSVELEQFDQETLGRVYLAEVLRTIHQTVGLVFFDTHVVVFRENGDVYYRDCSPFYPFTTAVINVIALPSTVINRITKDTEEGRRKRTHSLAMEDIIFRASESSRVAKKMASDGGFPYYQITNNLGDNNWHTLIEKFRESLQGQSNLLGFS